MIKFAITGTIFILMLIAAIIWLLYKLGKTLELYEKEKENN